MLHSAPHAEREATGSGCLSFLLFPPISVALAGALVFYLLTNIRLPFLAAAPAKMNAEQQPAAYSGRLAALFTPQVLRWEAEILRWADDAGLDPNLVATVMQIESCGYAQAVSRAGAMGLFQVMPYHFADGENSFDPDTNARRGLAYLRKSLDNFGSPPMAMAGYNGGINGASRPAAAWAQETRDYVYWGENIYADAVAGRQSSPVLQEWLAAGGASLCAQAQQLAEAGH
ncbi:MAG: transglycosylase SLT domain-containing protein [Anaerolineales bacterium]|nr:transglycosylase SLT domain-containing protein [Anaerolineales bacterium]